MKYISLKHKILALTFVLISVVGQAQAVNDVTLVVSSDGATKEEATKNALRSAIEQAYGTFVSANTTILNDELVQEEIVTIASGNIKSYKELSSTEMPDGSRFVTLQATVSISNLISYAKSKGSSTEFAGAAFGMNLKLRQLNKANELKVMENLFTQLEAMAPTIYDYELKMSEPRISGNFAKVDVIITVKSNSNTEVFYKLLANTLKSLSMTREEAASLEQYGMTYSNYTIYLLDNSAPAKFSSLFGQKYYYYSLYDSFFDYDAREVERRGGLTVKPEPLSYYYNEFPNDRFECMWKSVLYPSIKDNTGKIYSLVRTGNIESRYAESVYNDELYEPISKGLLSKISTGGNREVLDILPVSRIYFEFEGEHLPICFPQGRMGQSVLFFLYDKPGIIQAKICSGIAIPVSELMNISKFEIVRVFPYLTDKNKANE